MPPAPAPSPPSAASELLPFCLLPFLTTQLFGALASHTVSSFFRNGKCKSREARAPHPHPVSAGVALPSPRWWDVKPEPLFRLPSLPHSSCCSKGHIWSGACLVADLCSLEMAFQKGGCWLGCSVNSDWGLGIYLLPCPQELIPALQPARPPTAVSCSLVGVPAADPRAYSFCAGQHPQQSPSLSSPYIFLSPSPSLFPALLSLSFPAHLVQPLLLLFTTAASSPCGSICPLLSSSSSLSLPLSWLPSLRVPSFPHPLINVLA